MFCVDDNIILYGGPKSRSILMSGSLYRPATVISCQNLQLADPAKHRCLFLSTYMEIVSSPKFVRVQHLNDTVTWLSSMNWEGTVLVTPW